METQILSCMFNCRLTFPPLTADVLLVYLSFRHRHRVDCRLIVFLTELPDQFHEKTSLNSGAELTHVQ